MKKKSSSRIIALFMIGMLVLCTACGSKKESKDKQENPESQENQESEDSENSNIFAEIPEKPSDTTKELDEIRALKEVYENYFYIGVALNPNTIGEIYQKDILTNFNSTTCENEMKPDYIMDKAGSVKEVMADPTYVAVNFKNCTPQVKFCEENGIKMRFHTLVWHAQTPEWFFHVNYDTSEPLADAVTMQKRMKNYISAVINYFDTEHPDLLYTIDVVNEAFNGNGTLKIKETDNRWYDTIGYDYPYYAFLYAREALEASQNMKDVSLVYNDYSMIWKYDTVSKGLDTMFTEHGANVHDYIDAIGFQAHYDTSTSMKDFERVARQFAKLGYEIQVTELDIGIPNVNVGDVPTENQMIIQARKFRSIMERLMDMKDDGCNVTSVTVWGISDDNSWRSNDNGKNAYALLWSAGMIPKTALRGMSLCSDIMSIYKLGLE